MLRLTVRAFRRNTEKNKVVNSQDPQDLCQNQSEVADQCSAVAAEGPLADQKS
jgi:hypothetical protein